MLGCRVRMFWTLFHDHVRRFLLLLFFILNLNYLRVVIPNYDIWISRGLKTLILQTNLLFTRFLGSYGAYALIKLPFSAQLLILEHFFVMVGHLVVRDNLLNWLQVNTACFSPSWGLDWAVVFKNLHGRAFLKSLGGGLFVLPWTASIILVCVLDLNFISTILIFNWLIRYWIHGVLIDPCKHVQTVSFCFRLCFFLMKFLLWISIGQALLWADFLGLEGSMSRRNKRLVKFALLVNLLEFQWRLLL